mgnify:CR=1 FL=1
MLFLIFIFRSTPEQYFIYLHPHEHKHHDAYKNLVVDEAYHDCSDQLNYLSAQEFSEPLADNFKLNEFCTYCLLKPLLSTDEEFILIRDRSPPQKA